jgi:uncharacterized protein (TIGR00661 family)
MKSNDTGKLNIAISCNGEGRGHVSRTIALFPSLQDSYALHFWSPPSVKDLLSQAFPNHEISNLPSLHFMWKNNQLDVLSTILSNIRHLLVLNRTIKRLAKELVQKKIDIVYSDFEPFLSLAASSLGIPIIQLNHPGIIMKSPQVSYDAMLAKMITPWMMGKYSKLILCSFYNGDVGPIIRDEIRKTEPVVGNHIVIYVKKLFRRRLMRIIRKYDHIEFRIFPSSRHDFVKSLASAKAVIAPGGHQMISEALSLGKPILTIPEPGQFEQHLNAEMLERSGRGMRADKNNLESKIETFLSNLENGRFGKTDDTINFKFQDDTDHAIHLIESTIHELTNRKFLPFEDRVIV